MSLRDDKTHERFSRLEQASIDASIEGAKGLLLLNGGACVSILAFLGSTIKDAKAGGFEPLIVAMLNSLVWFSAAAGLSVLTAVFAYLSNQAYASALIDHKFSWRRGAVYNIIGLAAAIVAFCMFAVGVYKIYKVAPFSFLSNIQP